MVFCTLDCKWEDVALLTSCAFFSIDDHGRHCGSLDSTERHSSWLQVPNTAHLRSHAAGLCHLQLVVPLCLCLSMQKPTPQGPHCFLCLQLLFAPVHVLHAKTYFRRPSLHTLFAASLCSCTCAPCRDLLPKVVTVSSVCGFSLLLRMCAVQRRTSSGRHGTLYLQLLSVSAHALLPSTLGSDAVCIALHWANRGL